MNWSLEPKAAGFDLSLLLTPVNTLDPKARIFDWDATLFSPERLDRVKNRILIVRTICEQSGWAEE